MAKRQTKKAVSRAKPARMEKAIATINASVEHDVAQLRPGNFSERLVANAMSMRAYAIKKLMDPRRNIDDECGYPATADIERHELRELYDRDPISNRVVNVWPRETWQSQPTVYETEDQDKTTPFEMAWDQLGRGLKNDSWHQDEEGNVIWEHLARADELSGIGHFGIILLGIDDGKELHEPVDGIDEMGRSSVACKSEMTFVDEAGNEVTEADLLAREQAEAAGAVDPQRTASDGTTPVGKAGQPVAPGQATAPGKPSLPSKNAPPEDEEEDDKATFNALVNAFGKKPVLEEEDEQAAGEARDGDDSGIPPRGVDDGGDGDELADPNDPVGRPRFPAAGNTDGINPDSEYVPDGTGTDQTYDHSNMKPGVGRKPKLGDRKLLYIKSFSEDLVYVTRFEDDKANPRFGQPVEYMVTMHDPKDQKGGVGLSTNTERVHWTRVIHVVDNRGSSDVFGVPRMRPVINRLLDLQKLYGGSAEMYWRGAFPGYSVETHPQLGGDVQFDATQLRDEFEKFSNGLDRYFAMAGVSLKSVAPQVVDPTPQIDKQLEAVCIELGIPIPVFKGYEIGEQASENNDSDWNDRVKHRQRTYVTPRIIVPFVDRLIAIGVLPAPTGYSVDWEEKDSLDPEKKATVANTRVQAMSGYIGGGVEALMSPEDFLVREMGFTPDEATAIIEAAAEAEPLAPAAGTEMFDAQGNPLDPMTGQPTSPKGVFGEGGQAPLTAEDLGTDAEGRAAKESEMAAKGVVVAAPAGPPGPAGGPPQPGKGAGPPQPPNAAGRPPAAQPPAKKRPPGKPPVRNAAPPAPVQVAPLTVNTAKFDALLAAYDLPAGIDPAAILLIKDKATGRVYVREGAKGVTSNA